MSHILMVLDPLEYVISTFNVFSDSARQKPLIYDDFSRKTEKVEDF